MAETAKAKVEAFNATCRVEEDLTDEQVEAIQRRAGLKKEQGGQVHDTRTTGH